MEAWSLNLRFVAGVGSCPGDPARLRRLNKMESLNAWTLSRCSPGISVGGHRR